MWERLPENLLGFQVAFWRWLGFRGSGLARFSWEFEQKRMSKTGQPPFQAGLIYAAAGEADFPVRFTGWGGKAVCFTGDFIGIRTEDIKLVMTVSSELRFGTAARNIGAVAI